MIAVLDNNYIWVNSQLLNWFLEQIMSCRFALKILLMWLWFEKMICQFAISASASRSIGILNLFGLNKYRLIYGLTFISQFGFGFMFLL